MKLSTTDQLVVGFWLSAAVGLGIMSRSVESATSTLIAGAFFTTPLFAFRGITSPVKAIRRVASIVSLAWFALFVAGILSAAERLYYVNAATYPRWLASGELVKGQSLESLRTGECKGRGPIEITEKADGLFVIRCGLMWYDSKTYIAHFNPMRTAP